MGVTLVIPPGALEEPVEITIEAVRLSGIEAHASFEIDHLIEGTAYDFGPDGLQFRAPVGITIGYDDADVPPDLESSILIFRIDGEIEGIPSAVDEGRNEVDAFIDHFTVFAAGTSETRERSLGLVEPVGVNAEVTIAVRSTVPADVAEAIAVDDEVTILVHGAIESDVAEAIGVSDEVTIAVVPPVRSDVAEPIGVTDDVTIVVQPSADVDFAYVALQGVDSVAVFDGSRLTVTGW